MSKDKKKKKKMQQLQRQESEAERHRRLIEEAGVAKKEESVNENSIPEEIPEDVDKETRDLHAFLLKKQTELEEKEKSIDELVQNKADAFIKELGVDIPTAQQQAKDIIQEAKSQSDQLIEEAESRLKELDEKENALEEQKGTIAEQAKEITKEKIALENEKISYRLEIGNEISAHYKEQIEQIDSFESEKEKLERKAKYFKDQVEGLNTRITSLEINLADYEKTKREIAQLKEDIRASEEECKKYKQLAKQQQDEIISIGTDPAKYKAQYESLEKEYNKVKDILVNKPSDVIINEYKSKAEELDKILMQYEIQQKELLEAQSELTKLKVKASQVDDYVEFVRILSESKRQLRNELSALREEYESENNNKFKALTAIDEMPIEQNPNDGSLTLPMIVNSFVAFAQNDEPHLYYKEETVSAFISWMASTKIIILEGLSGTGKTSLPMEFQKFANWYSPRVSVQTAWKDRNDLVGFFNDFKKEYKETDFLKVLYKGCRNPDKPALIVLDEMNLSRIEYYFADFLSALEDPNEANRIIDLLPDQTNNKGMPKLFIDGGKLQIRPNIWFVGTANKDDSTFAITDKVYDRAGVIKFNEKGSKTAFKAPVNSTFVSFGNLNGLFKRAKKEFYANDELVKYLEELVEFLNNNMNLHFEINVGNRVLKQIESFVPVYLKCRNSTDKGTIDEAIDQFFPNKVLRKLEGLFDMSTKKNITEFITEIKSKKYKMEKTILYLNALQSKIE